MRWSRCLVEFEFSWLTMKLDFHRIRVMAQNMFYMSPSILASNLISSNSRVIFWLFWDKRLGCFEGWIQVQIVLESTHIVQQLLFSLFPSILTGPFFYFFFLSNGL